MIANVTLTVNALYIGFAKKNTFFTHVLEKSAEERRADRASATSRQNDAVRIITSDLSNFSLKLIRGFEKPATGVPDQVIKFNELFDNASRSKEANSYLLGSVYGSPTDWVRPQQTLVVDNSGTATLTPGSINPGTSAGTAPPGVPPPSQPVISDGVIAGYFENGKITQLTYKWNATLFGPINQQGPILTTNLETVLNNPLLVSANKLKTGFGDISTRVTVKTVTASTKQEWLNLSSPDSSDGIVFAVPAFFSSSISNTNYWLMLFEAECNVVIDGVRFVANSFSVVNFGRNSTAPILTNMRFDWSRYYANVSDAAAATSSTTTTSRRSNTPGSVYSGPFGTVDSTLPLARQIPF
jgi:hypothetical protein